MIFCCAGRTRVDADGPAIFLESKDGKQYQIIVVTFTPGIPYGITFNRESGYVSDVTDLGQAQRQGVKTGMRMKSVDGMPYTWDLYNGKERGSVDYKVTFEQEFRPEAPNGVRFRPAPSLTLLQRVGLSACCSNSEPTPSPSSAPAPQVPVNAGVPSLSMLRSPVVKGRAPNLNGSWVLSSYEGDMDSFLIDMGAGYLVRSAAASVSFGVGEQKLKISQDGDVINFEYTGARSYQQNLRIGGGSQDSETAAGPAKIAPRWEGGTLRLDLCKSTGEEQCSRWLYLDGGRLVMDSGTIGDTYIKQFYNPLSCSS